MEHHKTITAGDLQEATTDAFRRVVGRHKPHSVSEIALITGHCESYWGNVRAGLRAPGLLAFLSASAAMDPEYGAAFLNDVLALAGFTGVRPVEAKKTCPHKVTGDLADAIRLIAEALEDGNFDADERFEVATKLRALSNAADGLTETPKLRSV